MTEFDHPAEVTDDPEDLDGDYGRGWDAGYAHGYRRGFRDASQPTGNQPVAGRLVVVPVDGGVDDHER